MGYATTRSAERVAAAMGVLASAPIQFETACDVPKGGVLLALPALLAVGLLRHTAALYQIPKGFYGIASIFLLLALQALARIKSIEQLRYVAPGEWGNLLGLDRIPEVRTLRQKLEILCHEAGRAMRWNTELAKEWIAGQRESEMVFYVDGHVRVYHGDLTPLPPHYVARERLSPEFFAEMKLRRIAVLSYHKYPGEDWPVEEFAACSVRLSSGEEVTMKLAERGTMLSNHRWVREVRKLSEGGHQTSILSTNYQADYTLLAVSMFARWSQENFYKYMRQHYGLDRLAEYGTEPIPDPIQTVNPAWRRLDSEIRAQGEKRRRQLALFGTLGLSELAEKEVDGYQQKKGQLQEDIEDLDRQIQQLKTQRKQTPHHIPVKELPESDRFSRLLTERKHFIDTIKLIAYRAETSMASILRDKLSRADDARALLRQIYDTEVDLIPDLENKTLTVRLHHLTHAAHDEVVRYLCDQLNATATIFPDTELKLVYQLGASQIP